MWTRWPGTFAMCMLMMGCQLADNAVHNLTYEAKLTTAECREHADYEKRARETWDAMRSADHCRAYSKDYAAGFREGFVDYMQFGGTGQAPYVPPKCYWGPHYQTPQGHQAVEEWFAGFRRGAAAALESGCRKWVTLPSGQVPESAPVFHATPVDPGSGMPMPAETRGPWSPQRPPVQEAPVIEAKDPVASRPQTAPRSQVLLGAPESPLETIETFEVQKQNTGAEPAGPGPSEWSIEVINGLPEDAPPVVPEGAPGAKNSGTAPMAAPAPRPVPAAPPAPAAAAPVPAAPPGPAAGAETGQPRVTPSARPTFGPPVPYTRGYLSKD